MREKLETRKNYMFFYERYYIFRRDFYGKQIKQRGSIRRI